MTEAELQLEQLVRRGKALPHKAAVREVHDYFGALPPETARALVEGRPDLITELDGAPPKLRYRASHLILVESQRRLRALVESGEATPEQETRLATVDEMLRPVTGLDRTPDGSRSEPSLQRQFLFAEVEGQGRMIEVLGDLETARNVVVLIPGMNNDLDGVRAQMDRAQAMKNGLPPDTAVLVWKGHIAPMGLVEAMSEEYALAAVPQLSRFEAGLDVVTDADTTFLGNSYGSLLLARTLMAELDPSSPDGVNPDRAILIGCPGIDVTSAAQLTPPGTELFVGRAKWDYVAYAQQHGHDPAEFADVFRFDTEGSTGHQGYFKRRSEAMRNILRICRGDIGAVTRSAATTAAQESRLLVPGVSWSEPLRKLAQSEAAVPIAKAFSGVAALSSVKSKLSGGSGSREVSDDRGPRRPEGPAR